MENEAPTTDTPIKRVPSHPDCLRCQLSAAFHEMARDGSPYAQVAFLEKRKEMLGY